MLKFFNISLLFAAIYMMLMFVACTDKQVDDRQYSAAELKQRKESLEKANRYLVLKEKEDIDNYIDRHHLNVEKIGTGLYYSIVKQGGTLPIKRGNLVSMEYEVRFLNGDVVYSSKELGPKTFVVGRGGVENGLEEAIVHLHTNDVAVVIISSNMAHGLLGDGDKIPPKTPIVYYLKVIENQSYK